MKYHLCKATRIYNGEPYCGPTSGGLPAEADTLEEAQKLVEEFQVDNPVGWNIWNASTGKIVQGINFFAG